MSRPWHIWSLFSLCLAVVLAAVTWLSVTVIRLERAEATARRQAAIEDNVRLALWRADSALAPLIARESARPYFVYSPFYPAERAYTRMFSEITYGEVLVPSPLLAPVSPHILLHFQIDAAGAFSSPQAPTGNMRDLAEPRYASHEAIEQAAARLAALTTRLERNALIAALPQEPPKLVNVALAPGGANDLSQQAQQAQAPGEQRRLQAARSQVELQARGRAMQNLGSFGANVWNDASWAPPVPEGPLTPVWQNDLLLLARRVSVGGRQYIQGCWLDWPVIERWLAGEIVDLFPQARFEPVVGATAANGHLLAALPVRFDTGPVPLVAAATLSPLYVFLGLAWLCVLLAAAAVVMLLFGTVSLSERRAAFVSAVTHELRTPLTTFRLYTDMLTEGMVRDEEQRHRYLKTLHAEAIRLAHLVENVLAYARLERGRAGAPIESLRVGDLLDQVRDRLTERAALAGMELIFEPVPGELENCCVRASAGAVEQILFNLVDNACKYAAAPNASQIHVAAQRCGNRALLLIRDHGPGIAPSEARRLFTPFHKSARDAAHSAPGVGLGLALSRRLARRMGGDLRLAPVTGDGACFELALLTQQRRDPGPQDAGQPAK